MRRNLRGRRVFVENLEQSSIRGSVQFRDEGAHERPDRVMAHQRRALTGVKRRQVQAAFARGGLFELAEKMVLGRVGKKRRFVLSGSRQEFVFDESGEPSRILSRQNRPDVFPRTQDFAVARARARFLAGQEGGAELKALRAQGFRRADLFRGDEPARGDERDFHFLGDNAQKGAHSDERVFGRSQERRPMASGLEAGDNEGIDAGRFVRERFFERRRGPDGFDAGFPTAIQDRGGWDPEDETENGRSRFDEGFDLLLEILAEFFRESRGLELHLREIGAVARGDFAVAFFGELRDFGVDGGNPEVDPEGFVRERAELGDLRADGFGAEIVRAERTQPAAVRNVNPRCIGRPSVNA